MSDNILIIGGGPAGCSAALYLARAGQSVTLVENGPGALGRATLIENYYGVSSAGPELYARGLAQVRALGVTVLTDEVLAVDYDGSFTLSLKHNAEQLRSRVLILATGSQRASLPLPGLSRLEGHGVSSCAVCDGFFFRGKRVAVVGSGAYALHEAAYLRQLTDQLSVLTNGESGEAAQAAGFNVKTAKLTALLGEQRLTGVAFADGSTLELDGLFLALGTAGSTDIARRLGALTEGRFIKIDKQGATNLPGLFAAGDCTGGLLQIAKAVHEGAEAGLAALAYLKKE